MTKTMGKKVRQTFVLNKETDQDILDWIEENSTNKSEAIRDAIRAGMRLVQPRRPVSLEDVLAKLENLEDEIRRRSFVGNGQAEASDQEPEDIADRLDGLGL